MYSLLGLDVKTLCLSLFRNAIVYSELSVCVQGSLTSPSTAGLSPYLLAVAFEVLNSRLTVYLHKNELSPFVPLQHQLQDNSRYVFIFELQSLLEK